MPVLWTTVGSGFVLTTRTYWYDVTTCMVSSPNTAGSDADAARTVTLLSVTPAVRRPSELTAASPLCMLQTTACSASAGVTAAVSCSVFSVPMTAVLSAAVTVTPEAAACCCAMPVMTGSVTVTVRVPKTPLPLCAVARTIALPDASPVTRPSALICAMTPSAGASMLQITT